MSGIVVFFCYYINTMEQKRFKYKPSAVDQMIMGIIILAIIVFGGLIYLDHSNKLPADTRNNSQEVQQRIDAERQLREALNEAEEASN